VPPPTPTPAAVDPAADVRSFTRVAEITRKLYQQSTAQAVLSTAAKEIGSHWEALRCVATTGKPGQPPTAIQEYCVEEVEKASPAALMEAIACLQVACTGNEPLVLTDTQKASQLQSARKAIEELGAVSILAIPLGDGKESVGMLILMHGKTRSWPQSDVLVLKTVAEQMVIALNNAGLRRLVKNLSVTDEKSGLLKRASYIDLLLAESRRALQNSVPISVLLMQMGKTATLLKEHGEAELEAAMEKAGQLLAANIRSNDLAFRYGTTSIAIILGETAEKEAAKAVEKLRKVISEVRLPGKDGGTALAVQFSAGLAEAVIRPEYDVVDIVTEVINRAEQALALSQAQGAGKAVVLGPALAAGAVA
ncbi:MAG: diguanylate cyclase, partial [Candidatus Sulfotelmatobacter sp.]